MIYFLIAQGALVLVPQVAVCVVKADGWTVLNCTCYGRATGCGLWNYLLIVLKYFYSSEKCGQPQQSEHLGVFKHP